MSDFLNHLVTRSFQLAPGIQPRIPSRFEPSVPIEEPLSEVSVEWEITAKKLSSQPSEHDATLPSVPNRSAVEPPESNSAPLASPQAPFHPHHDFSQNPLSSSEVTDPGQNPSSPVSPGAIAPLLAQADLPQSSPNLPVSQTATQETEKSLFSDQPSISQLEQKSVPQAIKQISQRSSLNPVDFAPIEQQSETLLVPKNTQNSIVVQPGKIQSVPVQTLPQSETSPETTINVTIGRIEVRATPPAPSNPKPRPSSPRMSLEQYLQRRSGGR